MGFVIGSIVISIFAFVIALAVVRPLFALIFPRRKTPGLFKTFEVTAGWVSVGLFPATMYTILFQWLFGGALKEIVANRFPEAPTYIEPVAAFGVIYASVATVSALVILSHDHAELK